MSSIVGAVSLVSADINSSSLPPEPPEEPLASDCCGSGCATCVYDIFDQQRAQYEAELRAWREKHRDAALPLLKTKKKTTHFETSSSNSQLFDAMMQYSKDNANESADDDDEAEDDYGVVKDPTSSKFAHSCLVNLSQPPASVAQAHAVEAFSDKCLLTFRMDVSDWRRATVTASTNQSENLADSPVSPFSTSTLHFSSSSSSAAFSDADLRPGDTVEVLRLPPRSAVESFLRHFAGGKDIIAQEARAGSLLLSISAADGRAAATDSGGADMLPTTQILSDGIVLDMDRFAFVDSPLPPWLEKCSAMQRTQNLKELRTACSVLSIGHLFGTVLDVFSWSAVQCRPLLKLMLSVAESTMSHCSPDHIDAVRSEVDALRELVQLPASTVQQWLRHAWIVYVGSSPVAAINGDRAARTKATTAPATRTVGELLQSRCVKETPATDEEGSTTTMRAVSLCSSSSSGCNALLKLPIPVRDDVISNNLPARKEEEEESEGAPMMMGSVEFLLRCFPHSVVTQLFPRTAPESAYSSTSFAAAPRRRLLTLPRLLEVLPPLRGRIFSVAGTAAGEEAGKKTFSSIDLLSNFENQQRTWVSEHVVSSSVCDNNDTSLASAARLLTPPWSGVVSSQLSGSVMQLQQFRVGRRTEFFIRHGKGTLSQSHARKQSMLQQVGLANSKSSSNPPDATGAAGSTKETFSEALDAVWQQQQQYQQQQLQQQHQMRQHVLFLCAGTGFAPFRFFLQRQHDFIQQQRRGSRSSGLLDISLLWALRINEQQQPLLSCRHLPHFGLCSKWLECGVLSRADVALSSTRLFSSAATSSGFSFHPRMNSHLSVRAPTLLSAIVLPAIIASHHSMLRSYNNNNANNNSHDKTSSSSVSSHMSLKIFSCGPPSFLAACKSAAAASDIVKNQSAVSLEWFSDDWSS